MGDKLAEIQIREELGEGGGWDEKKDERYFDSTTDVFNRDALNLWGQKEIDIATRMKVPLTVVMFDIDDFGHVNKLLGHIETDNLLKKTIGELKKSLRKTDLVFRYGGDEFVIFLLDCDSTYARENILPKVEGVFSDNALAISTGVQDVNNDMNLEIVLKVVDKKLYEIKKQKKHE